MIDHLSMITKFYEVQVSIKIPTLTQHIQNYTHSGINITYTT